MATRTGTAFRLTRMNAARRAAYVAAGGRATAEYRSLRTERARAAYMSAVGSAPAGNLTSMRNRHAAGMAAGRAADS